MARDSNWDRWLVLERLGTKIGRNVAPSGPRSVAALASRPTCTGSRFSSVGDISERASSYLESQLDPVYRPSETIYSFLSKNLGSLHFSVLTIIRDLVKEGKHFRLDQHVIRKDSLTLGIFKIPSADQT